jgi:hypothetical protein
LVRRRAYGNFSTLTNDPELGDVVRGIGGCRKVPCLRLGVGKSCRACAIYYAELAAYEICMVVLSPKSEKDTIPEPILKRIREEMNMVAKKSKSIENHSGVELGLKLLESVRQMNAGKFARVTQVEVNPVAEARMRTGLSQAPQNSPGVVAGCVEITG